jgi:hypothetical protein
MPVNGSVSGREQGPARGTGPYPGTLRHDGASGGSPSGGPAEATTAYSRKHAHQMADTAPAADPGSVQLAYAELEVFADYNSFMVQDEKARFEFDRTWTRALSTDMIAARDGVIGVGTARRTTVPVILDIRAQAPDRDIDGWDHVIEAGLHVESGKVIVLMLDYTGAIPRTAVPAGSYTARVYATGFGTVSSDGVHGSDL